MGLATAPANLDEYIIKNQLTWDFEDFIHRVSGQSFEFQDPRMMIKSCIAYLD